MFQKIIAIDASPNLQKNDALLVLQLLLSPWKWQLNKNKDLLKNYFDINYPTSSTFLCQSGRAALYLIISSVIKPGDEVITQAFTCLAVPNAISWAGGKVVFVDIDQETYNIDPKDLGKKITSKTKVIIVQHTFGIPASLNQIKKICQRKKIFLIEDCAHALGATYDGHPVGSLGDAAVFSFNQDKVVSGVCGGAAVIHNQQISKNLNRSLHLTNISNYNLVKILLHPLIWTVVLPLYESFNLGKCIIWLARKLGIMGNTISRAEEIGKMPNDLIKAISEPQAKFILEGLQRLEADNKRRREIAKRYRYELANLSIQHPKEEKDSWPIYLRYPIQVEDPLKLFKLARQRSIILGKWYNTPVFPYSVAAKNYYIPGSCPVAEKAGEKIANLPTSPNLSGQEITRVINVVKAVYANS